MASTSTRIIIATAAASLALFGLSTLSPRDLAARIVHDVNQNAATAAVTVVEARDEDNDRQTIRRLIDAHRRGATAEWREVLAEAIYNESTLADVDPLMVASIVAKESSFKSRIVSHAGAVGLMQLRPFVAEDVALRGQVEWSGVKTLHSPDLNVRLGILYYKELVDRFEGDHHIALTAYNQGPTRVSAKLRRGTYTGSSYATEILGLYESIKSESAASKV